MILKGGFNINSTDAGTFTAEGGHIISFNSSTSNGGNLLLSPGNGVSGGANGTIKLDGVVTYGITTIALTGGTSGSPVSLLNQKSYVGLTPTSAGTDNYYQLPSPVTYPGRMYIIRNNSASVSAIITTAAGLLFPGNSNTGAASYTLNPTSSPKTIVAVSDGANWTVMVQN